MATSLSLASQSSLLERLEAAVLAHGPPRYALFTTYTFDPGFFQKRIAPLLIGEYGEHEDRVGLLVVCDSRNYRPHQFGGWVCRWPESRLFHPKIALLVFPSATYLFAGSGNLTHSGQADNIEALAWQSWDRPGLPDGVASLVRKLDGALPRALLRLDRLRSPAFRSSLDGKLAKNFERTRIDELFVVSPFFDQSSGEEADDLDYLLQLAADRRVASVRLYVPATDALPKPTIPGRQSTLAALGQRLRLFGVFGRPLHAKVIAARRGKRVRVMIGSANATRAGMKGKNVEAGWSVELGDTEFRDWLSQLRATPLKLPDVTFERPRTKAEAPIGILERAVLDVAARTLSLTWRRPPGASDVVRYEGRRLRLRGTRARPFQLSRDWHVEASHGRSSTCVPIEIEGELPAFRSGPPMNASPEELLRALVSPLDRPIGESQPKQRAVRRGSTVGQGVDLEIATRVRELADVIAAARVALDSEAERRVANELLNVARAHDPSASNDEFVQLWRLWVRFEIALLLQESGSRRLAACQKEACSLLNAPPRLQAAARALRTELRG